MGLRSPRQNDMFLKRKPKPQNAGELLSFPVPRPLVVRECGRCGLVVAPREQLTCSKCGSFLVPVPFELGG